MLHYRHRKKRFFLGKAATEPRWQRSRIFTCSFHSLCMLCIHRYVLLHLPVYNRCSHALATYIRPLSRDSSVYLLHTWQNKKSLRVYLRFRKERQVVTRFIFVFCGHLACSCVTLRLAWTVVVFWHRVGVGETVVQFQQPLLRDPRHLKCKRKGRKSGKATRRDTRGDPFTRRWWTVWITGKRW